MNELMLSMIGAFAQFERSVLKERQAEGIEKAKAKGVSIRALSRASIVTLY
jgi:DNA invertase Pin-like site-specific DNA recombinase